MSTSAVLTPLPVLIPLLGAAATMFAGRRPRLQRTITLAALSAVVAVCAALLYLPFAERSLVRMAYGRTTGDGALDLAGVGRAGRRKPS